VRRGRSCREWLLAGRGVRCELDDRGVSPGLRIYSPGERTSAESDSKGSPPRSPAGGSSSGREPIGSVTRLTQAAERIIDDLGLDGGPGGDGTGHPVASLAVWQMLRRARAGISSPVRPGPAPGDPDRQGPRPGSDAGRRGR
jgi:hypothetical protein